MIRTLVFGMVFGYILSNAGATDYDVIANMFLLRDFHLMGVMGIAILLAGLGMFWIRRLRDPRALSGAAVVIEPKPRTRGNLWGGLLFGVGWGLTGTCPGTVLAQVGEGKIMALFTLTGIVAGTQMYRFSQQRAKV